MPMAVFHNLAKSLSRIDFLVLNGIGEPLLHPDLEEMITIARSTMPATGRIGFQSNGLLLNQARAVGLLKAGLDIICLSLDSLEADRIKESDREGHQLAAVTRAIAHLVAAAEESKRPVRIGIEVVLHKETRHQLPDMVAWAGEHHVDFIIVSHLFSYDGSLSGQSLYNPNTEEATRLFAKWSEAAQVQGINLSALSAAQLKFSKKPAETLLVQLGDAMRQEARERELNLHYANLMAYSDHDCDEIEAQFEKARLLAAELDIELSLPALHAPGNTQRSCVFIENEAVFVDKDGQIMPCHFLWHTYSSQVNNSAILVKKHVVGSIMEESLESIWQKPEYAVFRAEARQSKYAPCWNCTASPCADLVDTNLLGIHDCYGSHVPCGHCAWSLGWMQCL